MKEYNEAITNLEKKNSDLKREREELQRANEILQRLSSAVEQGADSVVITDRNGLIQYANPAFEKLTGYTKEEVIGKTPRILKSGKYDQLFYKNLWETILSGKTFRFQFINRKKSGELYYTEETITPIKDLAGNITHFVSTGKDITQNKLTEGALVASEKRYRLLFDKNPLPMWVYDTETLAFIDINKAAIRHYGYSREEFLAMTLKDIRPPSDVSALIENVEHAIGEVQESGPWRHRKKDGSIIFVEIISHGLPYAGKNARIVLARDVTDRRRAEESLRETEKKYRGIFENATVGIFQSTPEGTLLTANPAAARIHGYESQQELIASINDIGRQLFANPKRREELKRLLEDSGSVEGFEFEAVKKDGSKIWISENLRAVRDKTGKVAYYEGFLTDITERRKTELALRESEERFRQIAETISEVFWLSDPEIKNIFYISPAYETVWGRTCESLYRNPMTFVDAIHTEDRHRAIQMMRTVETSGNEFELEFRIIRPDGSIRWIRDRVFPIRNHEGKVIRLTGIAQDITDRKSAEEERTQLIHQLQQAQKMEAIGQLAGGVAHDFNNVLMAVSGFSELLLMKMTEQDPRRYDVLELQKAAQQGANLTGQLLAFSRKQVLSPKILDVKASILKIKDLLQRLIGQNIELETYFAPRLGQIEADLGQLHQVLMNLAVNARDAMPNGGKLTIEASNIYVDESFAAAHVDIDLGPYIMIAVTDNGHGMDESTMNHIFEPFFTTKQEGKGTGLGLSTVYGIVKQSGGIISVYSQVGHGTTFKLYFPRVDKSALDSGVFPRSFKDIEGEGKTILITDDNLSVRSALAAFLELKGYHVLQASRGIEAIEIAKMDPIDLLISDVIMPEMSGQELARALRKLIPHLKILFISGYGEEAVRRQGYLEKDTAFLAKPVRMQTMLLKISELLTTG